MFSAGALSYSFADQVRDVQPVVDIILANSPTLFALIGDGPDAKSTKHEYLQDELSPYSDTVAATFETGHTTLTVADGTKFEINDILGFEAAAGAAFLEQVRVTNIVGNDLTVTRQYNSQAKVEVAINDIVKVVQRPWLENVVGGNDEAQDRVDAHNYTQIFTKFATVSRTQQQIRTHGVEDEINYQMQLRLQEMVLEFDRALISGMKHVGSATQPRTAGGIINEILNDATALKTGSIGTLEAGDIDLACEQILSASGMMPDILVCGPKVAAKISALDSSGVKIDRQDPATGRAVYGFRSAIPLGGLQKIVVVPQFPKDMALVSVSSKMAKNWLQRAKDEDATQKGQDGVSRKAVAELTFSFKNVAKCNKLLYGITI